MKWKDRPAVDQWLITFGSLYWVITTGVWLKLLSLPDSTPAIKEELEDALFPSLAMLMFLSVVSMMAAIVGWLGTDSVRLRKRRENS